MDATRVAGKSQSNRLLDVRHTARLSEASAKPLQSLTIQCCMQALFIQGGIQMIVSEVVVAILLAVQFNAHSGEGISPPIGVAVIVFICLFVAGFGWSWGPLGWLVPNEIQPLETRSAGQVNTLRCMP